MSTDPKPTPVVQEAELTEAEAPEAVGEQSQAPDASEPNPSESGVDAPPAPAADVEADADAATPEPELDPVAAKAAEADQYLALAQRTQADFENYRKRATREAAAAQQRGVIKLARELLPAVDDLDRALSAAQNAGDGADDTLVSGIKLVHADVIAALSRVGIEQYSPAGEKFDPVHHEAMAQQPVEGAEPGTVVEVYQRGYKLGDAVIRPARVVVAA